MGEWEKGWTIRQKTKVTRQKSQDKSDKQNANHLSPLIHNTFFTFIFLLLSFVFILNLHYF